MDIEKMRQNLYNREMELRELVETKMKRLRELRDKYERLAAETKTAFDEYNIAKLEKDEDGMYILGDNYVETKLSLV